MMKQATQFKLPRRRFIAMMSSAAAVATSGQALALASSEVLAHQFFDLRVLALSADLEIELKPFGQGAVLRHGDISVPLMANDAQIADFQRNYISACVHQKQLLVLDKLQRQIQWFALDGTWLKQTDLSSISQSPTHIQSAGDFLWLVDSTEHRISILTADAKLYHSWGELGEGLGQLNGPMDLVIDSQGNAHVLEVANQRISVWNLAGKWLTSYGEGTLSAGARSMAMDNYGRIHVLDAWQQQLLRFDNQNLKAQANLASAGQFAKLTFKPNQGLYFSV